jgi:hypothetical protein
MTTAAEIVDAQIAAFNANLEAITDPEELNAVAANMEAFANRYLTAAQASQLTETAANMRARAEGADDVVHLPVVLGSSALFPPATPTTD